MKRIIFGGSFDPIHKGHISIANSALKQINADIVHFVPCNHSFNKKTTEPGIIRKRLIEIAISSYNQFVIEPYELIQNQPISYTIDTINYLIQKYPNDDFYLLIGNDQLEQFHNWKDYRSILEKVKLLVYERDWKINKALILKYQAILINGKNINISSTLFKSSFDKQYLDENVYEYIIYNGLYHYFLLSKYMTDNRYAHSLRVATMMKQLFKKQHPELEPQAWTAGIYHDFCKCFDKQILETIAYENMKLPETNYKLLHGPVASYYLYHVYDLRNLDVLRAIARHTKPYDYGIGELTILDKALFCCDKLEPFRTNEDVQNIDYFRNLLNTNIDQCFHELLQSINKQYQS